MSLWKLTNDANDEDDEVKDVPAVHEVVLSERNDLHNEFYEEYDEEAEVEPGEDKLCVIVLVECFRHQNYHVQADQHHHENFKMWFGHQVEDRRLAVVLGTQFILS